MKITKSQLRQIIKEELADGAQGSNQKEIDKILDLIENDPEFQILGQFKDKFLRYMQSGGDPLSALEAASPEWRPVQKALEKLRTAIKPQEPKTPMGMPVTEIKMKITKSQLRKVIKEEVLQEASNQARLKELDDLIEDLKFIGLTKDLKDILTRHLREL